MKQQLATSLALSVAALFVSGCEKSSAPQPPDSSGPAPTEVAPAASTDEAAPASASDEKVNCLGINTCKGQSACDVEGAHECAGQNECKGKGWIVVPKSECDEKGGTVVG